MLKTPVLATKNKADTKERLMLLRISDAGGDDKLILFYGPYITNDLTEKQNG